MAGTFEEKKQLVMRYLPLGMSLEDCMFYAEMTEDEIERCENDDVFQNKVRYKTLTEQNRLLTLFDIAANNNAAEGKTADIRYKLGLINPKRFGDAAQKAGIGTEGTGAVLNINITNKTSNLKQDNVEVFEAEIEAKAERLGIVDAALDLKKE